MIDERSLTSGMSHERDLTDKFGSRIILFFGKSSSNLLQCVIGSV